MTIILAIINFFSGSFMGKVADYFQKRADTELRRYETGVNADTTIALAQIKAQIEARTQANAARAADRQSLWTAWMLPTAFAICMMHFGAIVLDSMPLFGHAVGTWRIAALPGDYLALEIGILASATGVVITERITTSAKRIFTR